MKRPYKIPNVMPKEVWYIPAIVDARDIWRLLANTLRRPYKDPHRYSMDGFKTFTPDHYLSMSYKTT